ncbi:MAG TPA: ATP-dependent DNA ligase [Acidimicrobiia bacterium]|nr:ATP-dependent DNA ligase [Acidimicrobiia bacterium]
MTLLAHVVDVSNRVAATSSRNSKVALLAELLASLDRSEIAVAVGFLAGEVRQGRIGVGYAAAFSIEVAPASEPGMHLGEVDAVLERIPATIGPGSQQKRAVLLGGLFARVTVPEQAFLRRLLTGELRQGALEGVMVQAVASAFEVGAPAVRRALMLRADLGAVAQVAASSGETGLSKVGLKVLSPLKPMLASPTSSIEDAISGEVSVEWKLDGARIQVHRLGPDVRVFTRNLNDVTDRLPEVVAATLALSEQALVLDGEAMALRADGSPQAFQETMSRFGTEERAFTEVPLYPFFFDILHAGGVDLIDLPLLVRLSALDRIVPPDRRIPRISTSDPGEASAFLAQALAARQEGVMVKGASSTYEAGRRGKSWRKVKPVHTYDLVVLAVEWGHGRRKGYLSNIHLGARDPVTGGFVIVGKTFKGMTDDMLAWQTQRFLQLTESKEQWGVRLKPEQVVEVAIDGVQASTRYPGGIALRFARVKRYREDKDSAEADTVETLRGLLS